MGYGPWGRKETDIKEATEHAQKVQKGILPKRQKIEGHNARNREREKETKESGNLHMKPPQILC